MTSDSTAQRSPQSSSVLAGSAINDGLFWEGVRRSAAGHAALLVVAIIASLTFAKHQVHLTPSIRVDLVALPDFRKKDAAHTELSDIDELSKRLNDAQKKLRADMSRPIPVQKEREAPSEKLKDSSPDAMSVNKTRRSNENSLKSAIDRIKALTEIESEMKKGATKPKAIAKGNQISKGASWSGPTNDAQSVQAYADKMRNRISEHWNLPVWLAKQRLNAQVQIFLDRNGFVVSTVVVRSSGNQQFDDFAVKSVKAAQPFGPPPQEILDDAPILLFPL